MDDSLVEEGLHVLPHRLRVPGRARQQVACRCFVASYVRVCMFAFYEPNECVRTIHNRKS